MNLKRHLMGCHGWDEFRASSARLNFDLNKKRGCYHRQKESPSKGVTPSNNFQLKVV